VLASNTEGPSERDLNGSSLRIRSKMTHQLVVVSVA
jgi:hypothetical protein